MTGEPRARSPRSARGRRAARPSIGRTIFDYADDLAIQMPASCQRSGRCHECVVEILGRRRAAESRHRARILPPAAVPARLPGADPSRRPRRSSSARCGGGSGSPWADDDRHRPGPARRASTPQSAARTARVTYDGEPLDLDRGRALGLAIDVGTTTVVVELVDLETGRSVGVGAFENPQGFGGSDVMNRISYDGKAPGELRRALSRALNHEIRTLCHRRRRRPARHLRGHRRRQRRRCATASSASTSSRSASGRTSRRSSSRRSPGRGRRPR